ncbi:pilus assembly protein TadG-related protein [Candidatus Omnitrophota bacterium]
MFSAFASSKTRYESGQVFPYLIAIMAVIIILALITVNLGQLAVLRTDVSNAADAGALAGASVLSGALLAAGLASDMLCASMLARIAGVIIVLVTMGLAGLPAAIAMMLTMIQSSISAQWKAFIDSYMAFNNCRQSAMRYAFTNVGIDESRPTYDQFLAATDATPTVETYEEYLEGVTPRARAHATTGFNRFMSDSVHGFWSEDRFGSLRDPTEDIGLSYIVSGYGWSQNADGTFRNSYDAQVPYESCMETWCWRDETVEGVEGVEDVGYDNFVEVHVSTDETFFQYRPARVPGQEYIAWAAFALIFAANIGKMTVLFSWAGPLAPFIAAIVTFVLAELGRTIINDMWLGFELDGRDQYTTNNHVNVTVRRFRVDEDLGLWHFRYGNRVRPVQAFAAAHTFPEDDQSVRPVFMNASAAWALVLVFMATPFSIPYIIYKWDDIFDTSQHLFETELVETQ